MDSVTTNLRSSPTKNVGFARRVVRTSLPLIFVVAFVVAGFLTLPWFKPGQMQFSHNYVAKPTVPASFVAGIAATPIPPSNDLAQVFIPDLTTLAQALPPEAIISVGNSFHLLEPVLISHGGRVVIHGKGRLILDHGAYIEVGPGGVLDLSGLTIRATGLSTDRGFLADVGGKMLLNHLQLIGLGRFATLARGVTFEGAPKGSGIFDSLIKDGAVGVFSTFTPNIAIVGNEIEGSRLNGIQIQGQTLSPLIVGNHVLNSGADGISLSGGTVNAIVHSNNVENSGRYGFLVNASPGRLRIIGNNITNAFNGVGSDNDPT